MEWVWLGLTKIEIPLIYPKLLLLVEEPPQACYAQWWRHNVAGQQWSEKEEGGRRSRDAKARERCEFLVGGGGSHV